MSLSMGVFFWLATLYIFFKYKASLSPYMDLVFLIIIIIFMYFINLNEMVTKCGSSNVWSSFSATIFPWICIFLPMLGALYTFPGWKGPFSNTFGYIIARLAGGNNTLLSMLNKQDGNKTIEYIYSDPSLLINQFSYESFDDQIKHSSIYTMFNTKDPQFTTNIANFKQIIYLKDLVSEWIWFLLTASVVTSTSSYMIANSVCTKSLDDYHNAHTVAMTTPEEEPAEPRVYTSTE